MMFGEMSQVAYNRLVTTILLLFFMVNYVLFYLTGKVVDWQVLVGFIVPTINHIVHQITQASIRNTEIKAKNGVEKP